ncbi:MAG: hypothetical protein AVDCRST_MAG18-5056 [uncultured Thermomicrobiales bacterium]|uniref:Uncharacterized protein n=1 Tax=uncultured Thermomicrobiales bacterium TaxID=1645740 RepID=A0A6J4VVF7_9BACT|nr:MAG: hypothetical protein AVDCRST_MAG18-5056 [uncultured Thermomicrobiales bacterium]
MFSYRLGWKICDVGWRLMEIDSLIALSTSGGRGIPVD